MRDVVCTADAEIIAAFRAGHPGASARLFDRYSKYIERLLIRVLGPDSELEDLMHETFIACYRSIHTVRQPQALKSWLTRLAVNTARSCIRKRRRRRWLIYLPQEQVPELSHDPTDEKQWAVQRVQAALAGIRNADERIAFTLRVLDGMSLQETADACGCSLATVKRRVAAGKRSFMKCARRDEELCRRYDLGASNES